VHIPGGDFAMGCHAETGETCQADELDVHNVYVNSFYMDVCEVTNERYSAYLNSAYAQGLIEVSGGVVYKAADSVTYCMTSSADSDSRIHWDGNTFTITEGKEDHPMVEVDWYGAVAYCNWRSAQQGRTPCYALDTWECNFDVNGYRLPTEAEWEYAARGGKHDPYYKYPWGNEIDGSNANYWDSGDPFETGDYPWTTPVGYYDGSQRPVGVDMANGYGLFDMAGNVSEWCNDWYDSDYYDNSPYNNPRGPASGTSRVLRGGSWGLPDVDYLRCADRVYDSPELPGSSRGFRAVAGR
jgi:formylglycine-generating enzyme required for sulfatase activity